MPILKNVASGAAFYIASGVFLLTDIFEKFNIDSTVSQIIISVALMLFGGFLMTRLTKRLRLPNVTAYITAGIILGPFCLNLVPHAIIEGMDFDKV